MPLFHKDDNTLTPAQEVKKGLATLAGIGIGAGAGVLATIPVDARYQNKLVTEGKKITRDKELSEGNWKILMKLYKGEMSLEDLPMGARGFFEEQLKENAKDLHYLSRNPWEAKESFKELSHGKLVPLFEGSEKAKMRGLFANKVHSPLSPILPGILGLAGAVGASYAANQHFIDKNKEA